MVVAKTLELPMHGAWVQFLVGELDPEFVVAV